MGFSEGDIVTIDAGFEMHYHTRAPGGEEPYDLMETSTRAAVNGGYVGLADMPNNPNPGAPKEQANDFKTWDVPRLELKVAEAVEHGQIPEFAMHGGFDTENPDPELVRPMIPFIASLKGYLGVTQGNDVDTSIDNPEIREFYDEYMKENRRLLELGRIRSVRPATFHALGEKGRDAIEYMAYHGYPAHWAHLHSKEEVDFLIDLKNRYGQELVSAEVTPHHLLMTMRDRLKWGWPGAHMQPELLHEPDADRLLDAFKDGTIDALATDHAPHPTGRKLEVEVANPEGKTEDGCDTCFGIAGIEFVPAVMMNLVQKAGLSMERFEDAWSTQPRRILNLPNTNANTTIEFGPYTLDQEEVDKVASSWGKNHPYMGWLAWGRVLSVEYNGVDILNEPENAPTTRIANPETELDLAA